MSNVPEKWRISCPLDHSSFEKFVNCDCNHGNARDVWWFKEQKLEKLQEQNKELLKIVKLFANLDENDLGIWAYREGLKELEEIKFHEYKILAESLLVKWGINE